MSDPSYLIGHAVTDPTTTVTDSTAWALLEPPAWHARAACKGMDTNLFYPVAGSPSTEVRAVCAGCPVRRECLDTALAGNEQGMWGGTTETERVRHSLGVTKRCEACQEMKPIDQFRIGGRSPKARSRCRACEKAALRARPQTRECPGCQRVLSLGMFAGPQGAPRSHCDDCHPVQRRCLTCQQVLPVSEFTKKHGTWAAHCRACMTAKWRERRRLAG